MQFRYWLNTKIACIHLIILIHFLGLPPESKLQISLHMKPYTIMLFRCSDMKQIFQPNQTCFPILNSEFYLNFEFNFQPTLLSEIDV